MLILRKSIDKLKRIAYNKYAKLAGRKKLCHILIVAIKDIIKVGLYLLSCLQKFLYGKM